MTQEELNEIAQREADELLAAHRTVVPMTPEQRAAAEIEKALLASRVILNSDPQEGAPRARRHGSQRPTGFPEDDEPPAQPQAVPAPSRGTYPDGSPKPIETITYVQVPAPAVDLADIDPAQLAEFAADAKQKRKIADSLRVEFQEADLLAREAQSRFLAYLQKP